MALSQEARQIILTNSEYFIEALVHAKNRLLEAENHQEIHKIVPPIIHETIDHYVTRKINFTINQIKKNDENVLYMELDGYEDVLKSSLHVYLNDIKKTHEFVKQHVGFMPTTNLIQTRVSTLSKLLDLL